MYGVNIGGAATGLPAVRGCAAWDGMEAYCQAGGSSFGSDWCDDSWCYVNPQVCNLFAYKSSYFPGIDLHFSYKKCNATFAGNTWVGAPEASLVKPSNPCACLGNGGAATNSSYQETIGNSCAAHDGAEPYCKAGGASFGADWCEDAWCYVDPLVCDLPVYASTYFPGVSLHFTYLGCDAKGQPMDAQTGV